MHHRHSGSVLPLQFVTVHYDQANAWHFLAESSAESRPGVDVRTRQSTEEWQRAPDNEGAQIPVWATDETILDSKDGGWE
jgi:hypothetical protein